MVARNIGDETFPKLLIFLRLLLPSFPRATHGIMANIVVVSHFSGQSAFYLQFGCVCARVRELGMRMYVTARSGPLYVCFMYVSRCMCARGRHACSPLIDRDMTKKKKTWKKNKKRRNAPFPSHNSENSRCNILNKSIKNGFKWHQKSLGVVKDVSFFKIE